MVLRFNKYNNLVKSQRYNTSMVKTWRYSSLKEFEQTMLSISEISRIYSLRSLIKTLDVSHFISTQYRIIFFSHVYLLFQLIHRKNRKSYYFLLFEQFWLLSNYSLQGGPGGSMSQVVGSNNSYKPITNTAWVRVRLCKLQKRVRSTRSRK